MTVSSFVTQTLYRTNTYKTCRGAIVMRISAAVAVACLMAGVAIAQNAKAAVRKTTSIPAQELRTALQTLATDREFQILYRTEFVGEQRTAGAAGELNMDEVLDRLLRGTGLSYQYLDDKTITILPSGAATSTAPRADANTNAAKGGEKASFWTRFRLAQVDQAIPPVAAPARVEADADADRGRLEEIVVTAQQREERLIDVPISIAAIGSEELTKRNIDSIDELALIVPGLSIDSTGGYSRKIALRGISNGFGSSSLTGLYLDEASVTSYAYTQLDLRTYDLERVEVLRGPQGTLYGEGSVGGTIRFITRNPQLDRFGANASAQASFTEQGEPSQRVEGAVNLPLIEDELGLRIAGTYDRLGGWIDQPAVGREDFNDQRVANVRIKGLWKISPRFTMNSMVVVHRNDASLDTDEDEAGNYTQRLNFTTTPSVQDDYELYNLTLSYDLPGARLLSTTSYLDQDKDNRNLGFPRQFFPPGTTPQIVVHDTEVPVTVSTLTQELRLTSTRSGPWKWTAGAFYRDARYQFVETGFYLPELQPGDPPPDSPTQYSVRSMSKSWAVFGDASYRVTDRLTLGTGLRYFRDDQEGGVACCAVGAPVPLQQGTFDTVNPRLYAQFRLNDKANLYTSAAKGFRSGGFNQLTQPTYDPESVWTYELGTKMSLADDRLSLDTAIFYSDYSDYQMNGLAGDPPVNINSNAGDALIRGIEAAVYWQATDNWALSVNGNYLDDELYSISATQTSRIVGDRLDSVPRYSYSVSVERGLDWNGRAGFARLDYSEQGESVYLGRNIGPWYVSKSDVVNMLNFKMEFQWSDAVSFGVFAQNLLNDRGYLNPGAIEGSAPRSRPRTFGVQVGMRFD